MRRRCTPAWLVVGVLCAGLISPAARAFEVLRADAACDDGVFRMRFEAVLAAPATGVAAVLADYAGYGKLDARIRRVELLGSPPDGAVLMRTRIQVCAGIFCRTVERVERVKSTPDSLLAEVIPERSDIRRGVARTSWRQEGAGTVVRYETEFEPDFWVPGFIAQSSGVRELRESTLRMFKSVEREANDR
ncbi:MAG: SRPBCC family protein [Gammaproteobacteria bacterium]|nr:SRPBCC family protein [Gammaproteobacteria bacterium]